MTKQLLAYHGKESLKQETITRMKGHISLDELVQGTGFDDDSNKGCAVGCAIDCYSHVTFSEKLGVDLWIPHFYDVIHEGLDEKKFAKFDVAFLEAIPVGMTKKQSDLIKLKLFYYQLTEFIPIEFQKKKSIAAVINLFEQSIQGITVTKDQWDKVLADLPYTSLAFASVSASAYTSVYVYAHAHTSVSALASAHTSAYAYASAHAHAHVYAHTPAFSSTSTHTSAYAYASSSEIRNLKIDSMEKIGYKLI